MPGIKYSSYMLLNQRFDIFNVLFLTDTCFKFTEYDARQDADRFGIGATFQRIPNSVWVLQK